MNEIWSCLAAVGSLQSIAITSATALVGLLLSFSSRLREAAEAEEYRLKYASRLASQSFEEGSRPKPVSSTAAVASVLFFVGAAILYYLVVVITFLETNLFAALSFGAVGYNIGHLLALGVWTLGRSSLIELHATKFDLFDDSFERDQHPSR